MLKTNTYVFGPVLSRRFGRSLGIDLIPFKTCPYDCIYCQLGRTTQKIINTGSWFPKDEILRQVEEKLGERPDFITFSGSGEPTLCDDIGFLIVRIKKMTQIPVIVLTGGSLLWKPEVRQRLLNADIVVPSLDAGEAEIFEKINRPADGIGFEEMVDGLVNFRKEFKGQYILEIMMLKGINTNASQVGKMVDIVRRISPDKVQLNTVARPPSEKTALMAAEKELQSIAGRFPVETDVVMEYSSQGPGSIINQNEDAVLDLLKRRPCEISGIAAGLNMHINEAVKYVTMLKKSGKIWEEEIQGKIFYTAINGGSNAD